MKEKGPRPQTSLLPEDFLGGRLTLKQLRLVSVLCHTHVLGRTLTYTGFHGSIILFPCVRSSWQGLCQLHLVPWRR